MLRNIYCLLLIGILNSCVVPYNLDEEGYKDLLTVDAQITNENKSHFVKLSRSIANLNESPEVETNAVVRIQCNDGTEEILKEIESGVYRTDSTKFVVKVGNTYKLLIKTSNGKSYSSNECEILKPSKIDRIYSERKEVVDVNNEILEGVGIFVEGKGYSGSYLRWTYEEDWMFMTPHHYYTILDENSVASSGIVKDIYCWKKSSSNEIAIHSFQGQDSFDLKGNEVCFIPSDNTDRFMEKYAINIKQLSISKEEYEYWNKLQITSEEVGDVFGTQPFSVIGNIKSEIDEKELVLGYFQTGSVTAKRIYFDYKDVDRLELSLKNSIQNCELDTLKISERYPTPYSLYERFVLKGDRMIYPNSDALLSAPSICFECSLTGSPKKPSFWED